MPSIDNRIPAVRIKGSVFQSFSLAALQCPAFTTRQPDFTRLHRTFPWSDRDGRNRLFLACFSSLTRSLRPQHSSLQFHLYHPEREGGSRIVFLRGATAQKHIDHQQRSLRSRRRKTKCCQDTASYIGIEFFGYREIFHSHIYL